MLVLCVISVGKWARKILKLCRYEPYWTVIYKYRTARLKQHIVYVELNDVFVKKNKSTFCFFTMKPLLIINI